jgi:hypothetical protein
MDGDKTIVAIGIVERDGLVTDSPLARGEIRDSDQHGE